MGWGGILGAIAQGLGTGIVKNVENSREEDAAQKEMDWRSNEYRLARDHESQEKVKDRAHEFDLLVAKEQSAIRQAVAEAKIRAQYSRSGSGENLDEKNAVDIIRSLGMTEEAIKGIEEQISVYGGKDVPQNLTDRLISLKNYHNNLLSHPETRRAYENGGQAIKTAITIQGYDPVIHTPKKPIKPSEAIKIAGGILTTATPAKTEKPSVLAPSNDFKSNNQPSVSVSDESKELYRQYLAEGKERERMLERTKNSPPYLSKYGL